MTPEKNSFFRRAAALIPAVSALAVTALVGAVAFFGFRYRDDPVRSPAEEGVVGRVVGFRTEIPEKRVLFRRWFALHDPSIPARGDADVGFTVMPLADAASVHPVEERVSADAPAKIPEAPQIFSTPEAEEDPIAVAPFPDFSVSAPEPGKTVVLRGGDGKNLPSDGAFSEPPAQSAERPTILRIIPAGESLCRLSIAESCGNTELDAYALKEAAKMKFDRSETLFVYWGKAR